MWLAKNNPTICTTTSYKLKYVPFDCYMHYNIIRYAWADICLETHMFTNGMDLTQSNIIISKVKRPFDYVQRHALQHKLHVSHITPMYAQTYFQNSLLINGVPTYIWSYIHITPLSCIYWIPNFFPLSHTILTLSVWTLSFTEHASICTNKIARFFMFYFQKGLKKISAPTITNVLEI